MKNILTSALLLFVLKSYCQVGEIRQEFSTPVQSVIVYLDGAEVNHSKSVKLNPGRNKLVFTGLTPKLDPKSIQVTASGDASILSISNEINYMANQKESARITQLRDSVTILSDAITQQLNDKDAFNTEKNMLLKNEEIGSKEKGVSVAELKLAADFYRARIKEINAEISKLDKKIKTLTEQVNLQSMQLEELNASSNQPSSEITILVSSNTAANCTVDLKYIVTDAGWSPSYDLRAEDIGQPIELKYRAKVFNNTGVDWNDVKLKLSTADPSQSASKPVLDQWSLNYGSDVNDEPYGHTTGEGFLNNPAATDETNFTAPRGNKIVPTDNPKIQMVEIQVSELSAEFDIKNNYTIPSDFKPYLVDVTEYKLPATYQHYSVPKLDKNAFLLARINGWEDLNLVEGPANVYYSGTYVGQSYINTRSADDTLDLSLGRDNKVLVTRTKVKEFCNKKVLGSFYKETFAYEMVVKNNRKAPITIEVNDQVPVSTQSDITVEAIETSKGLADVKTGTYSWTYTLQPGEAKKIEFSFSVKYPKNTKLPPMEKMKAHYNVRFL
ncbi:MAG: DUF4139 domain-containing protein [Bacteroidia bacterium]